MRSKDDHIHVLFQCPILEENRKVDYTSVLNVLPFALRREVSNMSDSQKSTMLLSALRSTYVPEWEIIYSSIANWVHNTYKARKLHYDNLENE